MKGSSYRERDYAFGRVMLTLRTRLGLTQTELAEVLGVGRRAVIDWEGGLTYPKADHLKQFIALACLHAPDFCGRARGRGDPCALESGAPEGAAR